MVEKLRPLPWESAAKAAAVNCEEGAEGDNKDTASEEKLPWGPQRKKRKIHGYKEDPFVFFTEDEPLWPSIR